jgi:DNA-binding MarR family transcriptional regulator
MRSGLLDELEVLLGSSLVLDARGARHTEATARVLLAVRPDEGVPMGEIARRMGRDASTATRFVDRAAREGLVERERGADRRRRLVFLTRSGLDAHARLCALREIRARRLSETIRAETGLGAAEVEWFASGLVQALARDGAPGP